MTNPRLGLYSGSVIPFPRKLMNTAISPSLLNPMEYARMILNILPNTQKAGSGAKRYGFTTKGDPVASGNIVDIMEYRNSSGAIKLLAYCDNGYIRILNESTGAWTNLISGLTTGGNPRSVHFNEKLIICDGVNPLMSYDGSTLAAIKEWVVDYDGPGSGGLASAASQTDTNTITVTVGSGRSDYAIGQRIRVTFATAGAVTATITGVSGTTTKTIDVSGTPFPNPSETINTVEYEYTAPAFSDIYTEHNRLWALSTGQTKASTFRAPTSAMKVYYTNTTNNEATWISSTTQELSYINLLNKSRRFDELVRISSLDGLMVFFGRHNTLIYAGDDPTTADGFAWQKTVPVGCINGNLVVKYPADILFFTRYGARSLRTVFNTEGQEVVPDLGSDIDPTVTHFVSDMVTSDSAFRSARAFLYERDGFYGFNLAADYCLAYPLSEESKGWVYLDGFFSSATAYLGTSDGRLIIGIDSQLYSYANGTDGATSYSDNNTAFTVKWFTPWIKGNGRWANIGFELLMEQTSDTTVTLYRAFDENEGTLAQIGEEISLTQDNAYWDDAMWDVDTWDGVSRRIVVRDKFFKDSFALMLQNTSTVGPIAFLGIRPIGK